MTEVTLGFEPLEVESGEYSNDNHNFDGESKKLKIQDDEVFGLTDDSTTFQLLQVFLKQAIPVVIAFFLGLSGGFINLLFAGQYSRLKGDNVVFAGIGLSLMFANVSGFSIMVGLSSAVETLGSQNNGAGNFKEVGIVLQRSILILSMFVLPIVILWQFTYDIFSSLGVDPAVCTVIQNYITIRALSVPCDAINQSYEKYLMSIGVMQPSLWSSINFNLCLLFFNYIFMHVLHMDYRCLAWSWVLSSYLTASLQIVLSLLYPAVVRTLQPWSPEAFKKWYQFFELGLPGTAMLCSEWWAYECLTLFSSLIGTNEVAAQTIIMQIASLAFMIPFGIGITCASLVGNSLGSGKIELAIKIGKFGLSLIVLIEIIVGLAIYYGGSSFILLYTSDDGVMKVAESTLFFLSLFVMIDGIQGVGSGILRGSGKQLIGAITNVIAFYVIGLPISWVLCFDTGLEVSGLIMGIGFATSFQVIVLMVMIFYFQKYTFMKAVESEKKYISVTENDEIDNYDKF